MALTVHITHIETVWATFLANADHGQVGILSDATADLPYEEFAWINDDKTKIYIAAAQKYWNVGGAAWVFLDADFDKLTVNDTTDGLLVAKWIRHLSDTDTRIEFHDDTDRIKVTAGGIDFLDIVETAQDLFEVNPGEVDIDFIVHTTVADTIFAEGSTGRVWIQKAQSGGTAQADADTFVVEEDADGGISIVVSNTNTARMAMGDATDSDYWECRVDRNNGEVYYQINSLDQIRITQSFFEVRAASSANMTVNVDCYDNGATYPTITMRKSDSDTMGTAAETDSGDILGIQEWFGVDDQPAFIAAGRIRVVQNGAANTGTVPADMFLESRKSSAAYNSNQIVLHHDGHTGVGDATPDVWLHVSEISGDTAVVREVLRLTHDSSGAATDGFGVRMGYELDSAGGLVLAGTMDVLWEDDSDGDADMVISLVDGDALAEVGRFTSIGHRRWSSAPITWDANQEAAFAIVDGVYNTIAPVSATSGGALFSGYNKGNANAATAVWLDAYVENNPDDNGAINFRARKHDGAGGLEALSAAAHVFTVENNASQVIAVHGDGATELLAAAGLYFGEQGTNDTWRIIRSGDDLDFDRREAGAYVTKFTVTAV